MTLKRCAGCNALTTNRNHQCPRPNGNGGVILDHSLVAGVSDRLGYLYCPDCVTQDSIDKVNDGKSYVAWSWGSEDVCDGCGRSDVHGDETNF